MGLRNVVRTGVCVLGALVLLLAICVAAFHASYDLDVGESKKEYVAQAAARVEKRKVSDLSSEAQSALSDVADWALSEDYRLVVIFDRYFLWRGDNQFVRRFGQRGSVEREGNILILRGSGGALRLLEDGDRLRALEPHRVSNTEIPVVLRER